MSNRDLFIKELAKNLNISNSEAARVSDVFTDTLIDCTITNGSTAFPDKFALELKKKDERICKNPQTKEEIVVPAKMTFKFTIRKGLKERLSNLKI